MTGGSILMVDSALREQSNLLMAKGCKVDVAESGRRAIQLASSNRYDVVLTEWIKPRIDGIEVLKYFRKHFPEISIIVVTDVPSIKGAVEATKLGAIDYLTKPVKKDEILLAVARALDLRDRQSQSVVSEKRHSYRKFAGIIGESKQIRQLFSIVEKVADTDSTVLIVGETGTGKELVAKAIHYHSRRYDKPLVAVNCGAIPEELLESELFGHEKGAFTNAVRTRIGRFELANSGTIFLDEVCDMSQKLQVKILRVLQERKFERVGGTKSIKTDVRIIAATNQDLERKVALGEFREDLFYRLNVIPVRIPPLRMRKSDIPLLVNHFLRRFNKTKGKNIKEVTPEVMDMLTRYHWPGNVRELENLMERLVIFVGKGRITVKDLPEKIRCMDNDFSKGTLPLPEDEHPFKIELPDDGLSFDSIMNEFGKRLILEALNKTGWVKKKAAQLLGLNRTTLIEKMKRMNLEGTQTKVKIMTPSTHF